MTSEKSLPQSIRVVSARLGGDSSMLRIEERPVPELGPRDILIEVAAAGLNRGDILQRNRTYPAAPGTEYDVLGLEVSGVVAAVGREASLFNVGEPVCALMKEGGYASHAVADERLCLPTPDGVSIVEAAALPETYYTVWANVIERGRLSAGQRFLVHGGVSGIGVTAIQLARHFGAQVYATAGTDKKCEACIALGAHDAINYRKSDFVEEIHRRTEGAGVDLILDMVAGSYLQRNLDALAIEGTVIMIGLLEGVETQFNITNFLTRRLTITGSTLWARTIDQKAAIGAALREHVWPLFKTGELRPVVDQIIPLERAAEAHDRLEQNQHIGKILLRP